MVLEVDVKLFGGLVYGVDWLVVNGMVMWIFCLCYENVVNLILVFCLIVV